MKQGISPSVLDHASLNLKLAQLQEAASVVADQIRGTNAAFYGHLAELYIWWRSASTIDGYLGVEYAKTGRKYKKKVKHGINFAPLFWLTWGSDNGLTDDKVGRWSRVMNKLHSVYEAEQQYHTDSVSKLQNFIKNSGGVDGLVGYGSPADEDDEGDDDWFDGITNQQASPTAVPKVSVDQMLVQLYTVAKDFYGTVPAQVALPLQHTLPTTDDGLSVVLVRKTGDTYQLVGASNDDTLVRPLAMQTYLNDFSAVPRSIRAIVELVSTQCMPQRLQSMYDRLIDPAAKSAGGNKRRAVRRVLYRHKTGEFILSPIRADSGVVTIAKPETAVLADATGDVYLSTRSRRALEVRMISGRDFNLYTPADPALIPRYKFPDLASHTIRIQHRFAERDYLHLDLWPFVSSLPEPRGQLTVRRPAADAGTWHGLLTLAWFRKFALEFTMPWVRSHGTHIGREHQNVMQLHFGMTALNAKFVYRDDVFEAEQDVSFDGATVSGQDISVFVLTKDFIIAMQAVADLGVVSVVEVNVDTNVLSLVYSTSAAAYRLYIPTCSVGGLRSTTAFAHYEPVACAEEDFERFEDQQEGDFDEARCP